MRFLFMLTRSDRTVPDCVELATRALALGVRDLGFKDVGAAPGALREAVAAAHEVGASVWLESVQLAAGQQAAELALELGVDHLMGGVDAAGMLEVTGGTDLAVLPFCGRPEGHPTLLGGSAQDIARDCRNLVAAGCAGADLLAWRAHQASPQALVQAARAALGGAQLIVAGSIRTTAQIRWLAQAGVDGFTVGTAVLDGTFGPDLDSALRAVMAATAASGLPPVPPGPPD